MDTVRIQEAINYAHGRIAFLENCVGGNEKLIQEELKIHKKYLEILEDKQLARALADAKPISNTVEMGQVILPNTNFFNESIKKEDLISNDTFSDEIIKSINNSIKVDPCDPLSVHHNNFMGGMRQ